MIKRAGVTLVVLLGAWPSVSKAQDTANVNAMSLGGRSGLMGGAGIAQGRDEGMLWINPAGILSVAHLSLSLSLGAYGLSTVRVRGAYRDPVSRGDSDWVDDGFSSQVEIVPASLGFFFAFGPPTGTQGHQAIAAGVFRPAQTDLSLGASYRESGVEEVVFEEAVRQEVRPTAFSLAYAIDLGFGLRAGASLFLTLSAAHLTTESTVDIFNYRSWRQDGFSESQQVELESWLLQPVMGAQWEQAPFSIGVVVRAPRLALSATGRGHYERLGTGGDTRGIGIVDLVRNAELVEGSNDLGWHIGLGAALSLDGAILELDLGLYLPMLTEDALVWALDDLDLNGGRVERRVDQLVSPTRTRATFNASLGAEIPIDGWSILLGLFSDRSTLELLPEERYTFSVDRYGGTLGVGIGEGPIKLQLGARYTFGTGAYGALALSRDEAGLLVSNPRAADLEEHRLLFLVSGALETAALGEAR